MIQWLKNLWQKIFHKRFKQGGVVPQRSQRIDKSIKPRYEIIDGCDTETDYKITEVK